MIQLQKNVQPIIYGAWVSGGACLGPIDQYDKVQIF